MQLNIISDLVRKSIDLSKVFRNFFDGIILFIRITFFRIFQVDDQIVEWFRYSAVNAWMEFGEDSFEYHLARVGIFRYSVDKILKLYIADQNLFVFFIPRSVNEFTEDLGTLVSKSDLRFVYGTYVCTRSEAITSLLLLAGHKKFDLREIKEKFPELFKVDNLKD